MAMLVITRGYHLRLNRMGFSSSLAFPWVLHFDPGPNPRSYLPVTKGLAGASGWFMKGFWMQKQQ